MAVECFFIQCQQSDISYFSSSDWSTLIFCLTIWSMCCNLSREYTPVKPKVSQKAEYQFVKWKPRFLVSSSPLVLFNLGQTGKSLSLGGKEKCLRHNVHMKAITVSTNVCKYVTCMNCRTLAVTDKYLKTI